ncbi:MAG TPA: DMT family transporter [Nocardioides sp.]|jgi:drug/metabolite transporter (DMT)-like permease|uniref:EamA family transporter n=1 Tax=Nocardioides sp. TaxID=35761 RepID=UPI002E329B32|nr:DMT family transporter [Nocardioides sp.]HEX3931715.1 DMT family transporter [Nocardioides sp.]
MATMTHDVAAVTRSRRGQVGVAWAVLAAGSFGLSGALASGLLDAGWSPAALVLCRIGVGAVALAGPAAMTLRGRWHLLRANAGFLVVFGLVAVAGCQYSYFNAVERLPVAIAILVEYVAPVAVVCWMWARHHQAPSGLTLVGAAVAVAGLLLVLDVFAAGSVDGVGVLWALGGMVGCAFFFVVSSGEENGLPPIVLAAGGLTVGSVLLGLAGLVGLVDMSASTSPASYDRVRVGWWVAVLALGVVTAAVSYVSGVFASRALGPRLASFLGLLEVLFSVVFAWLLLGQLPHLIQLLGGVLLLGGVIVVRMGEPEPS